MGSTNSTQKKKARLRMGTVKTPTTEFGHHTAKYVVTIVSQQKMMGALDRGQQDKKRVPS